VYSLETPLIRTGYDDYGIGDLMMSMQVCDHAHSLEAVHLNEMTTLPARLLSMFVK
jgi:hypothetical protein